MVKITFTDPPSICQIIVLQALYKSLSGHAIYRFILQEHQPSNDSPRWTLIFPGRVTKSCTGKLLLLQVVYQEGTRLALLQISSSCAMLCCKAFIFLSMFADVVANLGRNGTVVISMLSSPVGPSNANRPLAGNSS